MALSALTPFGLKCRELRLGADRRVIEHADALSITAAEITDYETGREVPSEEYIRATAYWLKIRPEDLEVLLRRRSRPGQVVKFTESEERELKKSRKTLRKVNSLSAFVMRLDDYRGPAGDG
jgi:transcriptional regulator with XRE-family HTH domain